VALLPESLIAFWVYSGVWLLTREMKVSLSTRSERYVDKSLGSIRLRLANPPFQYFSQFGDVTRLRVSRNKKTGASKHYAL
jgi:hypothetical protein